MRFLPVFVTVLFILFSIHNHINCLEVNVHVEVDTPPSPSPTHHDADPSPSPVSLNSADDSQRRIRPVHRLAAIDALRLPYDSTLADIESTALPMIGDTQNGHFTTLDHKTTKKAFASWAKKNKKKYTVDSFHDRVRNWYFHFRNIFYHNKDPHRMYSQKLYGFSDETQEELYKRAGTRPAATPAQSGVGRRLLQQWDTPACDNQGGQCIPTSDCDSSSSVVSGICHGPDSVICCVPAPTQPGNIVNDPGNVPDTPTGPVSPSNPNAPATNQVGPDENDAGSWDWRQHGNVVTPPRDQGQCGACWAFSSIEAIESNYAVKNQLLTPLSPQQLVDCTFQQDVPAADSYFGTTPKNSQKEQGCTLGYPQIALFWAESNPLMPESLYPFAGTQGSCANQDASPTAIQVASWSDVASNEAAIIAALQNGPLIASLTVVDSFFHYQGGVYSDPACGKMAINHATLLIGYGTDNGTKYWLAKNSWNASWGEGGFYRIQRGVDMCSFEDHLISVATN